MSRIVGLVFPEETKEEVTGVSTENGTPAVTNPETSETATSAETIKSEEPEKDKKKGK